MGVNLLDWWPKDIDLTIAQSAWVSTGTQSEDRNRIEKVVSFIYEHNHDTPKESVWTRWHLTVPIYVERQLDKYRLSYQIQDHDIYIGSMGRDSITQNEYSGRYKTLLSSWQPIPNDVKDILDEIHASNIVQTYETMMQDQHKIYKNWLSLFPEEWRRADNINNNKYKRCREFLRGICGTATLTQMQLILNFKALEHILIQRLDPATQTETRDIALEMLNEVQTKIGETQTVKQIIKKLKYLDFI